MTAQETITSLTEYGEVMRFEEKHGYPIGEDVLDAIDNAVRLLKEQEEELASMKRQREYLLSELRKFGRIASDYDESVADDVWLRVSSLFCRDSGDFQMGDLRRIARLTDESAAIDAARKCEAS